VATKFAVDRVKQLIATLFEGISKRVEGELGLTQRFETQTREEHARHAAASTERTDRYQTERSAIESESDSIVSLAGRDYQAHYSAASEEFDEALRVIKDEYRDSTATARQEFEETRWMVVSYYDENVGGSPKQQFEQYETTAATSSIHLEEAITQLSTIHEDVVALLKKRRMWTEPDAVAPRRPADTSDAMLEQFEGHSESVRKHSAKLKKSGVSALFAGLMPLLVFVGVAGGLTACLSFVAQPAWLGFKANPPMIEWVGMLGLGAVLLTAAGLGILFGVSRGRCESSYLELAQSFADAKGVQQHWSRVTQRELSKRRKEFDKWHADLVKERDSRLLRAQQHFDSQMAEYEERRTQELSSVNQRYPALLAKITAERDQRLKLVNDEFPDRLKKLEARYEWDHSKLEEEHARNLEMIRQQFDFDWQNMAQAWHATIDTVRVGSDRLVAEVTPISQQWPDMAFGNWEPAKQIPQGVRVGNFSLRLGDIDYGLPEDDRLTPEQDEFHLPAMIPFPQNASVILRMAGSEGRAAAVTVLRVAMLRLLATLPPGKVRLTIIDPIGLGENFSAFMHLADYDELMVTSRIWTETGHIEQRLTDLTEHMETVFQTYLRNEFKTIEEYNEFAGEVAEPYHVLVIAGFPASFTEQACRRLTSIMSSGPKCGVYTLMSVDTQLTMLPSFNLSDVESEATRLTWHGDEFRFDDEDLAWLPLELQAPPEPDEFTRIVKRIGDESKDARRVEVSFERVAPRELWQLDSRSGLDVPLGRAGATKLQHMRLGKGTSQHVLIAGKTGSGKSTFMHILVTNLALHYSPAEIEFYLIDFKKGVEFKTYAANQLPHAKVIAIESDREFGLSVLQRLDAILKERGDLFRDNGVQDIASFRNANPNVHMPRLMLLIDEFQEFFTEDDRIGQQAALLLDRIVRQGRAFGMHVLLGSQTLGGAYSLARSTLGQVAVRIALQCSESDAHLILSEDNTAARLLTRPGEAIYNDANGLLEGNHAFQIAWLNDDRRDLYLEQIRDLTVEKGVQTELPIVFEGNVPAEPARNRELVRLVDSGPATEEPRIIDAWLGEAVAIKPHTTVRFRRLAGSNLMVIGQSGAGARGILSSVLIAAAAQMPLRLPVVAPVLEATDHDTNSEDGPNAEDDTNSEEEANAEDDIVFAGADAFDDGSPSLGEGDTIDQLGDGDIDETTDAPSAHSMDDKLAALKSFSFASMKFDNPVKSATDADAGASGDAMATSRPSAAQFYILDGELADAPDVEFWSELASRLGHDCRVGGPADAAEFISELATVVSERDESRFESPIFLIIDNLGRFRDIRKDDDDYGFSSDRKKTQSPGKQFVEILKNGPSVGVHTVVWCDTYNNAGRWMSNQTMRELELKIAFQMSATDSSNFLDSPAAGKLGQNRALLYLEETGSNEKFRPYGLPSEAWLDRVHQTLGPVQVEDFSQFDEGAFEESSPGPDAELEVVDDLSSWTIL